MEVKFYITTAGRNPVLDFLYEMSHNLKSDFFDAVLLLESGTRLQMPLNKKLSGIYKGLQELRLKDRHGIYRFFYFIKKKECVYFLHTLKKKSRVISKKDKDLIIKKTQRGIKCPGKASLQKISLSDSILMKLK